MFTLFHKIDYSRHVILPIAIDDIKNPNCLTIEQYSDRYKLQTSIMKPWCNEYCNPLSSLTPQLFGETCLTTE